METIYYEDALDGLSASPRSVFLAGPTARGVRTPWRARALELFAASGFDGAVVLPEFRDTRPDSMETVFGAPPSPVPTMRAATYNTLHWETRALETVTALLFWMPFVVKNENDPESLPGFTTRAEVSRELVRDPKRLVLGMPKGAVSGGHIRFHAARGNVVISATLEETVTRAMRLVAQGRAG